MERVRWLDVDDLTHAEARNRVYLGHETLATKLPTPEGLTEAARIIRDAGGRLTLVTPPLSEPELTSVAGMLASLNDLLGSFEVVCNDWGLVQLLAAEPLAEPIIGRLICGQAVDPRLAAFDMPEFHAPYERDVQHADGSAVRLLYQRPSEALMLHLRSLAIDVPELLSELSRLGVKRVELSHALQGYEIILSAQWRATLHVCDVPVSVASREWVDEGHEWHHPTFPVPLVRRDNALYYNVDLDKASIASPLIDRLVYRDHLPR